MINILILTIITLVVIAALAVACRPKDRGTPNMTLYIQREEGGDYEPVCGIVDSPELNQAMLDHLQDEFNHKPKL